MNGTMPLNRYDMRRPSSSSFEDALEVRICRTLWGRLQGACWLLFSNWKFEPYFSEWLVQRFFAGRWICYLAVAAISFCFGFLLK